MPRKQSNRIRPVAASVIKEARTSSTVSQIELSNRLKVSQPLISSWECGRVTVGIEDVLNIESALGLPKGTLLSKIAESDLL
jgi:transcriptional regulator with XRE-family HTH domain